MMGLAAGKGAIAFFDDQEAHMQADLKPVFHAMYGAGDCGHNFWPVPVCSSYLQTEQVRRGLVHGMLEMLVLLFMLLARSLRILAHFGPAQLPTHLHPAPCLAASVLQLR